MEDAGHSLQTARWLTLAAVTAIASITVMELLLGLAVLAWVARLLTGPRREALPHLELTLLLGLLALWSLAGTLLMSGPSPRAFSALGSDLMWLAAPLATAVLAAPGRRMMRTLFLLQGGLLGAWALAERFLWWDGDPLLRVRGPYSHHMTLAGVLLLLILQALPRPTLKPLVEGRWGARMGWGFLALALGGLAATQTRSAVLALCAGFAFFLLVPAGGGRRLWRSVLALVMMLGISAAVSLPWLLSTPTALPGAGQASIEARLDLWQAGAEIIAEQPLLGVGINRTRQIGPDYLGPDDAIPGPIAHLHSAWLTLAAERGLPALGLLFWLYARSMWHGRMLVKNSSDGDDAVAGAMAALCGFLVMGLFEDNFDDSEVLFVHLMTLAILWQHRGRAGGVPAGPS